LSNFNLKTAHNSKRESKESIMEVLSLFDGISTARVALERANIPVKSYRACEIDLPAIKISKNNFPDIIHEGSVNDLKEFFHIDLLIGGSPCQDISISKRNREGLKGKRSSLFWEYVRIKELLNPKYFIFENVNSMSKDDKQTITEALKVEPIMLDASLVSAQSRKRLFWTNIPTTLPEDRHILLKDILEPDAEVDPRMLTKGKSFCLDANYYKGSSLEHSIEKKVRTLVKLGHIGNSNGQANRVYSTDGKSVTLSANGGGLGAKTGLYQINGIRKLTPIECERLQSLPDNYTQGISNTQRYKCLGNAFNADIVAHILKSIK
jgi:DNA (cytosine-5)-methyltransferase 3A